MTIVRRLLVVALSISALALPTLARAEGASAVVDTLHATFIDTMKNAEALGYRGRYDKLAPAIEHAYDMAFMAEKVVGRYWKELDDAGKSKWRDLFTSYTVANYAGRFEGYTGEAFETLAEVEAPRETVIVQTKLVLPSSKAIEFNYRMHQTEGSWRIIDVYMNGTVSELALRRSDFAATLKEEGFDKLVESVTNKIAELEKGAGGDPTAAVLGANLAR